METGSLSRCAHNLEGPHNLEGHRTDLLRLLDESEVSEGATPDAITVIAQQALPAGPPNGIGLDSLLPRGF